MFGKRLTLFRVGGIDIGIDLSWAILFLLITWSLARGLFPVVHAGLAGPVYWWMAIAGALGLFASVLVHELAHALMARRDGVPVRSITLFLFGGVAEMAHDPERPRAEMRMAIVGPLASAVLALALWGLAELGASAAWPVALVGVLAYLAAINMVVAVFNLLPAFPMDGGRVLRAALWAWRGDLRWATRIASSIGSGFGLAMMALGVVSVLLGNFIGGIWWFIIGMFLRSLSASAYREVVLRQALRGEPVSRFMRTDPIVIPSGTTLAAAAHDFFYRFDHKLFPVVAGNQLIGCLTPQRIKEVPRDSWDMVLVDEVAPSCMSCGHTISPRADVADALKAMDGSRRSRLMVVDDGRLLGVITLKDLLHYVAARVELEGEDLRPGPLAPSRSR